MYVSSLTFHKEPENRKASITRTQRFSATGLTAYEHDMPSCVRCSQQIYKN